MRKVTNNKACVLALATMLFGACGGEKGSGDLDGNRSALGESELSTSSSLAIGVAKLPKVNFSVLTKFPYEVKWETDGKTPDPNAFALRVPSAARSLHGRRVAVDGYMIPISLSENDTKTTEFLLLPDTKACCEGETPKQNGWILVSTPAGGVNPQIDKLLRVRGELTVKEIWNPADGFFKGLYHMTCEDVTPVAL